MYPDGPSIRTLQITVQSPDGSNVIWTGRQARKNVDGKPSILTVLDAPERVAGFAILAEALDESMDALWVYVPAVNRVRRMVYDGRFENFLGTEFSVEDFGFADLHPEQLRFLGEVVSGGGKAYVFSEIPLDQSGYSKILTWVAADSYLPMRRELFDSGGKLWKTQRIERVAIIDGIATPTRISVVNEQEGGMTELVVRDVDYAAELDDRLFRPAALPSVLANLAW